MRDTNKRFEERFKERKRPSKFLPENRWKLDFKSSFRVKNVFKLHEMVTHVKLTPRRLIWWAYHGHRTDAAIFGAFSPKFPGFFVLKNSEFSLKNRWKWILNRVLVQRMCSNSMRWSPTESWHLDALFGGLTMVIGPILEFLGRIL